MKKNIKIILIILGISLIFILVFLLGRKISLNSYLNKTIDYSKKINYTTNITLNVNDSYNNSKINYEVIHSSYIDKIMVENYTNNKLTSNILKYIVKEGSKKGSYVYDDGKYEKSDNITKEFDVDYDKLKKSIKSIKKTSNISINDNKYKKYTVKMKSYDAYNLIYEKEILTKTDSNKYIEVDIYIDKANNFIYKIEYSINNLNNSNSDSSLDYNVKIINKDINNTNDIKLPF